jgi:hypothetical protein
MPTHTKNIQLPFVQLESIKDTHNKHELSFLSKLHSALSRVFKREFIKGGSGDRGDESGFDFVVKDALALVCERFHFVVSVDSSGNNWNGMFLIVFGFCVWFVCLFCFVLFCFVLFCFVLFCFVLFCFVLFCFVLFVCF